MLSLIPTEHWDYTPADMVRGLLAALSRRPKGSQSHIHILGLGPCLPVRSARAAIVLALRALALRPGASVAVPLYCCPVVFSAIKSAGCSPRFVDVDPDTYCISATDLAAKSSGVDAVIAVHMFGNLCNMPALRKAAPGKPFVEDCAQALGSRIGDRLAGSFGDVAAFSFRSGKYVSVGEGGAVYCKDSGLNSRLSELIDALPLPSRTTEAVHVVATCLRSLLRTRPLWGVVGNRLWSAYTGKLSVTSQSPVVLGRIYVTDRSMAVSRLPALASQVEIQRRNADYYSRNLAVDAGMLCSETPGTFFNRLQYPLLLPTSAQRDRLAQRLYKEQISTAMPYKDIVAIATRHYGYSGDCPQAERIAERLLVIPCNHALKPSDVDRIASCVNSAWARIADRERSAPAIPTATLPQSGDLETIAEPNHSS